jgi:hypothetical protein
MSLALGSVRTMNDGRRRRKAKQARRDARRTKNRNHDVSTETPEATPLIDEARSALATGHPLDFLGMTSLLIEATKPDSLSYAKAGPKRDPVRLDAMVNGFIGVPIRETTALLAVLAEMLVDNDELQLMCRREAGKRHDPLPQWISELAQVDVYEVVRMTHVLGDGDELLIGARFPSGHEMTCVAYINHLGWSEVRDAFFVPEAIDRVVAAAMKRNDDSDISFVNMSVADARAWIELGLRQPMFTIDSDSWPGCRALVHWLIGNMPAGGQSREPPDWLSDLRIRDDFFASPAGAPFDHYDHGTLLLELIESGTGDPLRWSAARLADALRTTSYGEHTSPESVLDVPELLRAFVPFAHAQAGIRDELTAEAIAVIDDAGSSYKQEVLRVNEYLARDEY